MIRVGGLRLGQTLAAAKAAGRKAFVPYVTGGLPSVDPDLLRALASTGADAIEVGIPFSDPVMDGPVIQEASRRAVDAGVRPQDVLAVIAEANLPVPVAVMTYLNPVLAIGEERFAELAVDAGVTGAIVPDLPVDEADSWVQVAGRASLDTVFLAAPNTVPERLARIAAASGGFVYCVSTFGVTGAREDLSSSAEAVVAALRPHTDTPLLVGVGISTPEHATLACAFADGVVVGTAIVEPLLAGDRDEALRRTRAFRGAATPPIG